MREKALWTIIVQILSPFAVQALNNETFLTLRRQGGGGGGGGNKALYSFLDYLLPEEGWQCVKGPTWSFFCNDCVCLGGQLYICTWRNCGDPMKMIFKRQGRRQNKNNKQVANQNTKMRLSTFGIDTNCVEGEEIASFDTCNKCYCGAGKILCTNQKCSDMTPPRCSPGTMLPTPDNCNSCSCNTHGRYICTTASCGPELGKNIRRNCKPGIWYSTRGDPHCRECFCLNGMMVLCYVSLCDAGIQQKVDAVFLESPDDLPEFCEVGDFIHDKCTKCRCTKSIQWSCKSTCDTRLNNKKGKKRGINGEFKGRKKEIKRWGGDRGGLNSGSEFGSGTGRSGGGNVSSVGVNPNAYHTNNNWRSGVQKLSSGFDGNSRLRFGTGRRGHGGRGGGYVRGGGGGSGGGGGDGGGDGGSGGRGGYYNGNWYYAKLNGFGREGGDDTNNNDYPNNDGYPNSDGNPNMGFENGPDNNYPNGGDYGPNPSGGDELPNEDNGVDNNLPNSGDYGPNPSGGDELPNEDNGANNNYPNGGDYGPNPSGLDEVPNEDNGANNNLPNSGDYGPNPSGGDEVPNEDNGANNNPPNYGNNGPNPSDGDDFRNEVDEANNNPPNNGDDGPNPSGGDNSGDFGPSDAGGFPNEINGANNNHPNNADYGINPSGSDGFTNGVQGPQNDPGYGPGPQKTRRGPYCLAGRSFTQGTSYSCQGCYCTPQNQWKCYSLRRPCRGYVNSRQCAHGRLKKSPTRPCSVCYCGNDGTHFCATDEYCAYSIKPMHCEAVACHKFCAETNANMGICHQDKCNCVH